MISLKTMLIGIRDICVFVLCVLLCFMHFPKILLIVFVRAVGLQLLRLFRRRISFKCTKEITSLKQMFTICFTLYRRDTS